MQYVILGLLLQGPLSLYDLHKHFTASVSLFYSASYGSLKRALSVLVDAGHVQTTEAPVGARRRTLHTITPAGREAWRTWMHEPVTASLVDTVVLAKVFFLDGLQQSERGAVVATLLERVDRDLERLRAVESTLSTEPVPEDLRDTYRYRGATLDFGIRSYELMQRWLVEVRDT
jgi:DNA-binding PadR family transcriptional regulator